jgi:voltage-gated sodium channel
MATLEDWTDVFYINYYGCDKYRGGLYVTDEQDVVTAASTLCTKPQANPVRSMFFFFPFVVISSLVLLSMFIGAITISMSECVEQINQEVKQIKRQKQAETEAKLLAAHRAKAARQASSRDVKPQRSKQRSVRSVARIISIGNTFK